MSNLLALVSRLDRIESETNTVPSIVPSGATGVTLTAAAGGAFARGAYAELAAASAISSKYKPVAVIVEAVSAADEYEIDLAVGLAGSEADIGRIRVTGAGRYTLPSCSYGSANARLAARVGCFDAVARTANIAVEYIDGLDE